MQVALDFADASHLLDRGFDVSDLILAVQCAVQYGDAFFDVDVDLARGDIETAECLAQDAVGHHLIVDRWFRPVG
jgi:hypothetical protein